MVHKIFQVVLGILTTVTAQYMPQMHPQAQFVAAQPNAMMQMQMPNAMPGVMQPAMSQPMLPSMPHMPGAQPTMQLHMAPMQVPLNGARLPVVMMPHYTKKNRKNKPKRAKRRRSHKRVKIESSGSDESSDSSSEYEFRTKAELRPKKTKRREVLTPVVSYVTKDGYVIYQKKIKKDKAKEWLEMTKDNSEGIGEKVYGRHRDH